MSIISDQTFTLATVAFDKRQPTRHGAYRLQTSHSKCVSHLVSKQLTIVCATKR